LSRIDFNKLLFTVRVDQGVKTLGGGLLKSGGYVRVNIKRHRDRGMAQPLLDYLWVYALFQHQ